MEEEVRSDHEQNRESTDYVKPCDSVPPDFGIMSVIYSVL